MKMGTQTPCKNSTHKSRGLFLALWLGKDDRSGNASVKMNLLFWLVVMDGVKLGL
jgi:hypothetical protein